MTPVSSYSFSALVLSVCLLGTSTVGVPSVSANVSHGASSSGDRIVSTDSFYHVPPTDFALRRQKLVAQFGNSPVLVMGTRGPNLALAYLSGYQNTGKIALLIVPFKDSVHTTVFVDSLESLVSWTGQRWSLVSKPLPGLQHRSVAELSSALQTLLPNPDTVVVLMEQWGGSDFQNQIRAELEKHSHLTAISKNAQDLNLLRAVKSPAEHALIRRAVAITNDAHRNIMRELRAGMLEGDVKKVIDSVYKSHGADLNPAFLSIVASGPNSTDLHYHGSSRIIKEGEHVKIDIGAAFGGYAADVTRTYPVSGVFSPEQRAIYQIVRDAQAAAEAVARPGAAWMDLVRASNRTLGEGLTRLGLMTSSTATYYCGAGTCSQLSLFFTHGLGHGLGLQVHDPKRDTLVVGTAFVIEPGIYVRESAMNTLMRDPRNQEYVDRIRPLMKQYGGIGVRIEDSYLITDKGLEWLSQLPRDLKDVEAAMAATRKKR